jgi:hypothetical protein
MGCSLAARLGLAVPAGLGCVGLGVLLLLLIVSACPIK